MDTVDGLTDVGKAFDLLIRKPLVEVLLKMESKVQIESGSDDSDSDDNDSEVESDGSSVWETDYSDSGDESCDSSESESDNYESESDDSEDEEEEQRFSFEWQHQIVLLLDALDEAGPLHEQVRFTRKCITCGVQFIEDGMWLLMPMIIVSQKLQFQLSKHAFNLHTILGKV